MSNIIMATPLSDTATITATAALGDNPVLNLQKRELSSVYRTSLVCHIDIDMGAATAIDFVALLGHNGQGTVTVKAGTTSSVSNWTSLAQDLITGTDYGFDRNAFAIQFATQTYRYWRIEIDDTGNPDGYFQAGRVYLSKIFQPSVNASYGFKEGYFDRSRNQRTIAGGVSSVNRTPLKTAEWSLDFVSETEMYGTLRDIDQTRGTSKDVLLIPDIEDTTYFQKRYVYGILDELSPIVIAYHGIYQKSYKITEII
jgi:hypothetical protein